MEAIGIDVRGQWHIMLDGLRHAATAAMNGGAAKVHGGAAKGHRAMYFGRTSSRVAANAATKANSDGGQRYI